MITRALEKYVKIAPKKLQPVARLLRNKKVEDALYLLISTNKKGASILRAAIESARSNARGIAEKKFDEADLYISKIVVNEGPALSRYRAMSMGRAGMIKKRTSHVLVELDAKEKSKKAKKPVKIRKKG